MGLRADDVASRMQRSLRKTLYLPTWDRQIKCNLIFPMCLITVWQGRLWERTDFGYFFPARSPQLWTCFTGRGETQQMTTERRKARPLASHPFTTIISGARIKGQGHKSHSSHPRRRDPGWRCGRNGKENKGPETERRRKATPFITDWKLSEAAEGKHKR